jgi:predicted RNA-binding protein with PIN domain
MPYLIDGHNVIGRLPDVRLDDPNDEAKLVQKLAGFAARTGKRCAVIFDSGLPGGKSRMSTGAVEVVFASHRSDADRLIMERIRTTPDPTNWTVVSSDNRVLTAATGRRMKTLSSADFATLLQTPSPVTNDDPGEVEDVRQSEDEINYWLARFTGKPDSE